jgi:hypothetical protein
MLRGGATAVPTPTFDRLCELEPRLRAFEEEVRAVRDDGAGSFFCSNYVWLGFNTRLRFIIGVARRGDEFGDPPELYASDSYEAVFNHLSPLLPPCRACGCRMFQPDRDAQIDALRPRAS